MFTIAYFLDFHIGEGYNQQSSIHVWDKPKNNNKLPTQQNQAENIEKCKRKYQRFTFSHHMSPTQGNT